MWKSILTVPYLCPVINKPNPITGKKIQLISGHEITGSIQEVGRDVHNLAVGDRMIINGQVDL